MNWTKPQTGTPATDFYRENKAIEAMHVLDAGRSAITKSGDHANGNELCTEVIARFSFDSSKTISDNAVRKTMIDAVHNLRAGNGYHKKQSDHSGGNTCAAVIAAATG